MKAAAIYRINEQGNISSTGNTLDLAITATLRGMGITLADESMIGEELANGSLIALSDIALQTEWAYYLIYPQELADLLQDNRFPQAKRHIRRLYPDPITNSDDWGLLRSIDGRITGVYSRSDATPFKRSGFSAEWSGFEGMEHYSDWQFVAEQAFTESARGVQTNAGPGDTP